MIIFPELFFTTRMSFWCWHVQTYGWVELAKKKSTFVLPVHKPLFQQCCCIFFNIYVGDGLVVSSYLQCFSSGKLTYIIKCTSSLLKPTQRSNSRVEFLPFVNYHPDYGWTEGRVWKFLCNPSSLMNFNRSLSEVS